MAQPAWLPPTAAGPLLNFRCMTGAPRLSPRGTGELAPRHMSSVSNWCTSSLQAETFLTREEGKKTGGKGGPSGLGLASDNCFLSCVTVNEMGGIDKPRRQEADLALERPIDALGFIEPRKRRERSFAGKEISFHLILCLEVIYFLKTLNSTSVVYIYLVLKGRNGEKAKFLNAVGVHFFF